MIFRNRCVILAFLCLGFVADGWSQDSLGTAGLKMELQKKLDVMLEESGFPGVAVAITLSDGSCIQLASGFEDADVQKKMHIDAKMLCGSTGKTFVSAVALQLISEGKFQLDDLASEYLNSDVDRLWFDPLPNSEKITIRSLLNHTSGLPRYLFQEDYLADLKANPMVARKPVDGLKALHGAAAVNDVGEGWSYSDSNYLVIGMIIERVTGRLFYELATERLLDPLELTHTQPTTQPKLEGLIQGHIGSVNLFDLPSKTVKDGRYAMDPSFEWCGGGFVSNVEDLSKWLFALHTGKVLKEPQYSELVSPVDFRSGEPASQGYGLGSFVWNTEHGLFFGHAGIMPGYLTQIEFSQEHKFSIALQTNTDEGMGQRLHSMVQELASLVIESAGESPCP